eukprot:CAMPEP_0196781202 /NCGR_PEP_ID=MMETSP1104-20130614/9252_1 /TAXON_ID=33652 /ORGANISM="Cafeteria sp., Strain Caron Lab Isolate" /LENGTH=106 /DNA_ID=CAMNT_0042151423 /DNA_START=12 /DNA_END=330 /DNA_ORIENTATION=+
MADPEGFKGSISRCSRFFSEYRECMVLSPDIRRCAPLREDYLECLHNKKKLLRMAAILAEAERVAAMQQGEAVEENSERRLVPEVGHVQAMIDEETRSSRFDEEVG